MKEISKCDMGSRADLVIYSPDPSHFPRGSQRVAKQFCLVKEPLILKNIHTTEILKRHDGASNRAKQNEPGLYPL